MASLLLQETSFTCDGKEFGGYYADPEMDCQAYHICLMVNTLHWYKTKICMLGVGTGWLRKWLRPWNKCPSVVLNLQALCFEKYPLGAITTINVQEKAILHKWMEIGVWKVWRSLMWSLWDWSSFEETVPPAEVVVVMLLVERKEPLTSSRQCRALPSPTSSSSTNDLEIIFSHEFVTLTLVPSCQPRARRS